MGFSGCYTRCQELKKTVPMLPTGLHRHPRTGFYYFRRRIPADILRCYPGKRELVYSLKTKVYRDAVVRLNAKQSAVFAEWERHRQRLADQAVRGQMNAVTVIDSLTPERIDAICQDFEVMSLAGDEARRLSDNPYEPEEVEEYVTGYSEANRDMKIAVATGNLNEVRPVMEQFLALRGMRLSASEADLRRLLLAFSRAAIRTNEKLLKRYDGQDVPTPERTSVPNAPRLSTVIKAHLDYYEKENKPAMQRKLNRSPRGPV